MRTETKIFFDSYFQETIKFAHKKNIPQIIKEMSVLQQCLDLASDLETEDRISVDIIKFAKMCVIVAWCESNLDTKANGKEQHGLWQFTKNTRRKLNMPVSITDLSIKAQTTLYWKFLINCDPKLLKKVKTPEDLHFLNFKPFGKRMILATRNTNDLDFDDDGWITPADLKTFQLNRIRENSVIEAMYKSLSD